MSAIWGLDEGPALMSQWLDDTITGRLEAMSHAELVAELLTMHRTIKAVEEMGEVVQALLGTVGANPRKGVTHTTDELVDEQLDVALSILGSVEHATGNMGQSEALLRQKVGKVLIRAGLVYDFGTEGSHE